jgi:CopG family transcriptional regulator, nickel-responsive regulator
VQRFTISLDDSIADAIDKYMVRHGYSNRSEAIRDLVRDGLVRSAADDAEFCVAAVSYVYRYDGRDLAMRLDRAQHEHHDLSISSMRTRLDHQHCMEVTFLRGKTEAVRKLADSVLAERGVRFGQINLVPVRSATNRHSHGGGQTHVHHTPAI